VNTSPLRHEPRPGSAVVLVSTGETLDVNTLSCESDKEADLYAHQLGYLPVFASPAIPDLQVVSEYFYGCIACVLSLHYVAVREALSASSECVVRSEERMPPVQTSSCPLALAPLNAGGHIDASVGKNLDQKMRITFPSAFGQGDPYEACALIGLVKKTKDTPTLDMTQACRRCVRAVRVQSAT
jgi:hypothetical protein